MWAYDRGHDNIANILKHFRRPGMYDDYARGEYLSGLDTSYFPIPSPIGKLRTMIQGMHIYFLFSAKEKAQGQKQIKNTKVC